MNKEKALNLLKDIGERAAWTFVQGFLVCLVAMPDRLDWTAIVAAAMAGLSALKTLALEYAKVIIDKAEEKKKAKDSSEE